MDCIVYTEKSQDSCTLKCTHSLKHSLKCTLSDFTLGSMRNVWHDGINENRVSYLRKNFQNKIPVNIELVHSKSIIVVYSEKDCKMLEKQKVCADGIITDNPKLLPIVTVADCMPIFLWAKNDEGDIIAFGVLHSGWKGTGICVNAVDILHRQFGAKNENIYFVLGPHIRNCCYTIDAERAEYFSKNFTSECVEEIFEDKLGSSLKLSGELKWGGEQNSTQGAAECDALKLSDENFGSVQDTTSNDAQKFDTAQDTASNDAQNNVPHLYRLSLEKANLALLEKCGIPKKNITLSSDCTCCTREENKSSGNISYIPKYGSFRRQKVLEGSETFNAMMATICLEN